MRLIARAGATPLGAIFLACGLVVAAAVGLLHLDRLPVTFCAFKAVTGVPCMGCGTTRAFARLFNLDLPGAVSMNPLSAAVALALTGASLLVLRPGRATNTLALVAALAGGLAIPALHVGLGALLPRYDAPNAVSVALSSGGLFALVLSTGLSLLSTLVVSNELRLLLGALLKMQLSPWPLLLFFLVSAAAAAIAPLSLAAKSLATRDISIG